MKWIVNPVIGSEFATVERLDEWEEIFESLGATKQSFGFFTAAGWMAKNGKEYEYRADDYGDEKQHGGEQLRECAAIAYSVAEERGLPYVSGFAVSRSGAWVPHCWNLNEHGRVLDLTWHCPQYEVAKDRQYIGRRVRDYCAGHMQMYEILFGKAQKAGIYSTRFEYALTQVSLGRYIVRDWHQFFKPRSTTKRRLLTEAEFANQMTIRECEQFTAGWN